MKIYDRLVSNTCLCCFYERKLFLCYFSKRKTIFFIKDIVMLRVHPIYNKYGYNVETDQIVHIPTNNVVSQRIYNSGYPQFMASGGETQKNVYCHRFIWETCNDIIPKGYEIDHIDKDKTNNKISNLRCITLQENRKHRDFTNILKFL